jgi:hypothetical protein
MHSVDPAPAPRALVPAITGFPNRGLVRSNSTTRRRPVGRVVCHGSKRQLVCLAEPFAPGGCRVGRETDREAGRHATPLLSHGVPPPARPTPRVRSFSSSEWGRHLESAARRPRALIYQQSPSRYSRFDDGQPSPSPNREWIHLGTKGTPPTIKKLSQNGGAPTGRSSPRPTTTHTSEALLPTSEKFPAGPRFPRRLPKSFHSADLTTSIRPALPHKPRNYRRFVRALCRTRTDDPFLTMEVLYQLS